MAFLLGIRVIMNAIKLTYQDVTSTKSLLGALACLTEEGNGQLNALLMAVLATVATACP